MSLIIFMVTLIGYTEGQPLYNDIENDLSFYTTQACYKECYDRDVQLQTQVTCLENQLKSLREKEEILQFQVKCGNKNGKYKAGNVTDTQYCFIRSKLTWDDGKTECQSFNSYLLEINSEAEQNWLMKEISSNNWWIGAKEDTDNEVWVWDHSGNELVFTNWDPAGSQPSGGSAEGCAFLVAGLWHDYPCNSKVYLICERDKELFLENQVNKLTKEVKSIKGWTTFINSEYWLGRDEVTWDKAKLNCMAEDGKLVEKESYAEDNFVRALAMKLTKTVWLGGTDVGTEGRWVWGSDRSPFTYSAWNRAKGQPNNYNNQDCLSLYRPYNLTWCDEKCKTRY